MAKTKTYSVSAPGVYTAQALDSTGTYQSSEISNSATVTGTKFLMNSTGKFIRTSNGKFLFVKQEG